MNIRPLTYSMISTKKGICGPWSMVSSKGLCSGSTWRVSRLWGWGRLGKLLIRLDWKNGGAGDRRKEHAISVSPFSNSMRPLRFSVISSVLLPSSLCLSSMSPYWVIFCLESRPCEDHPTNDYTTIKNKALLQGPAADWRRLQVRKESAYSFSYSALPPSPRGLYAAADEVVLVILLAIPKKKSLPKSKMQRQNTNLWKEQQ